MVVWRTPALSDESDHSRNQGQGDEGESKPGLETRTKHPPSPFKDKFEEIANQEKNHQD